MSNDLAVRDYLKTQGLKLPADEVLVAKMVAQAVMASGQAAMERNVLWYANEEAVLSEHIDQNESNEAALRQIFMALDSIFERSEAKSAAVYGLMQGKEPFLLRLAQQGTVMEQRMAVDDENTWSYLAVRSAQTGWLNIADDVAKWLEMAELKGAHHNRSQSQMSLPICLLNGRVLGVLHVEAESKHAFDETEQALWVGLALALAEPMQVVFGASDAAEEGA
ncbi:MAG: hypothetical protein Q4A84_03690 [Neisseria sp.]|uniref:GAF domain-containing protein n=1 Tax=Neisseria sp. TaxID=192066 RepID=UPI0026DC6FC3|nr:GAF domain-containing protein [Neisseria sp.]MDO4640791.1 hypothetical protein [Neisseria sp.]